MATFCLLFAPCFSACCCVGGLLLVLFLDADMVSVYLWSRAIIFFPEMLL